MSAPLPHVIAWNLTRRCNLTCAHCYISAGPDQDTRDQLDTAACLRIVDELLAVNPAPMLILSGGEPLLRQDVEQIAARATAGGATVVVGTNGTALSEARLRSLRQAGVQGMSVSVDALDPVSHDRFRGVPGALERTLAAVERLRADHMPFVVQTTLTQANRHELPALAAWAADRGASALSLYFVVATGRATEGLGLEPAENEQVLEQLVELARVYRGRMMVRAKCQPQIMRHLAARDPGSPLLGQGSLCPAGIGYCRITPEGKVTPCPYTPLEVGDLRRQSFQTIWREAPVLKALRAQQLQGRCGRCELRAICGGCRARAHATGGELLGPDPACDYDPPGDRPVLAPAAGFGAPAEPALTWTAEARARIARVPSFARGMVVRRIEARARERQLSQVTVALLEELRSRMPHGRP